jgi:protoheme IX farnesyltransferase
MSRAAAPARVALDFVVLTKPRITAMVVLTALGGSTLAVRAGATAAIDWGRQLFALVGIALVVSGAGALNMAIERDVDALMTRTAGRPLPAGRVQPLPAVAFGAGLAVLAIALLGLRVNALTAALAAASLLLYAAVYTPLKQKSAAALFVGAVSGAMPPLLGWTAATGAIGWGGLALFAVLFLWQLPHFIAISVVRSDEFARAGIRTLPAALGEATARRHAIVAALALAGVSVTLAPLAASEAPAAYVVAALLLGGGFAGLALRPLGADRVAARRWARGLFLGSLAYLPLLFAAMVVGL